MMRVLFVALVFWAGMRADAMLLERALNPLEAAEIATLKRDELVSIAQDLLGLIQGRGDVGRAEVFPQLYQEEDEYGLR